METRSLGLGGRSSNFGERGITKRLGALAELTDLTGERLLDIGCGNGNYTMRLAEGFDTVDAIDVEPERLSDFAAARADRPELAKIGIQQMPAEHLRFEDGSFDVVTAIEVLEHVADLEQTVAEVARVLRPGGRFLITSPNRYFPLETHGVLWGSRRRPPYSAPFLPWVAPLHRRMADARTFTVRSLSAVVERHGGLVRTGATFIMPPLDKLPGARVVRPVVDAVERSPLRRFGMALVVVYRKEP